MLGNENVWDNLISQKAQPQIGQINSSCRIYNKFIDYLTLFERNNDPESFNFNVFGRFGPAVQRFFIGRSMPVNEIYVFTFLFCKLSMYGNMQKMYTWRKRFWYNNIINISNIITFDFNWSFWNMNKLKKTIRSRSCWVFYVTFQISVIAFISGWPNIFSRRPKIYILNLSGCKIFNFEIKKNLYSIFQTNWNFGYFGRRVDYFDFLLPTRYFLLILCNKNKIKDPNQKNFIKGPVMWWISVYPTLLRVNGKM